MSDNFKLLLFSVLLLVALGATYSNHWQNTFHFDDDHTVERNVYIQNMTGSDGNLQVGGKANIVGGIYAGNTQVIDANGLVIDHDDTSAYMQNNSFALLLHGTQPKGSKAAKALSALRKEGIGGYGKQKKARELAVA